MIKKIIKKFFFVKFRFLSQKNINLVIFDNIGLKDLELNLLKDEDYFVLKNRINEIDEIFISFKLLFKIIVNLKLIFKKKFFIQDVYFLSLIEILNPKIVFTYIDNSPQFSKIAKYCRKKNIKFVALQNGMRHYWNIKNYMYKKKLVKNDINKDLYLPNYLCFSQFEKDQCLKLGIEVNNFKLVGSLRLSNFLIEKENKNLQKNFDICLISDYGAWHDQFDGLRLDIFNQVQNGYLKLIKWTIKYAIDNNLKFIFAFKRFKNSPELKTERNFYEKNLSPSEYNYIINNSSINEESKIYGSYYTCFKSKLNIAKTSTLLRELFVSNNKIFSCNLTGSDLFNYPIQGICSLNNCSSSEFNKRIDEILSLSETQYFSKFKDNKNYLVNQSDPKKVIELIKKELT